VTARTQRGEALGLGLAFALALELAVALAGCGADSGAALDAGPADGDLPREAGPDSARPDAALVDLDQDGLDDGAEQALAQAYLPYLSLSPTDGCARSGLIFRLRPHPAGGRCLLATYVWLYDRDCGSLGGIGAHDGDDETFGVTIDPTLPAPQGLRAIRAISHQGTLCERVSECGDLGALTACETLPRAGTPWPALWSSKNKHGGYVNKTARCTTFGTCIDTCEDNATPTVPPLVNVGEPGHPLVRNLTTQGFITSANGWTSAGLSNYDPWGMSDFGGAGSVAGDLVDTAFDTPACP